MLREVVVIGLACDVRIIEHPDGAYLIAHYDDRLAKHFSNLRNPIVLRVLVPYALHLGVCSQAFTEPF
jgi:hypothetical protein